jgi:uncharacterized protein (DUF302 family)
MVPRTRPGLSAPRSVRDRFRRATLVLGVAAVAAAATAQNGPTPIGPVVSLPSLHDFATTVERLEAAIEAAGLTLVMRIDHAENAAGAGLELLPSIVFVFGNPEAGTPLMRAARTLALDLPQRMLVWEDEAGVVFVTWRDPVAVAADHGLAADVGPLPDVASLLPLLAEAAVGPD